MLTEWSWSRFSLSHLLRPAAKSHGALGQRTEHHACSFTKVIYRVKLPKRWFCSWKMFWDVTLNTLLRISASFSPNNLWAGSSGPLRCLCNQCWCVSNFKSREVKKARNNRASQNAGTLPLRYAIISTQSHAAGEKLTGVMFHLVKSAVIPKWPKFTVQGK